MQLATFAVTNFRSITKTETLRLGSYSAFAGPNNEGKSNLLEALVIGLRTLDRDLSSDSRRRAMTAVRRQRNPRLHFAYDWERDFPLQLQESYPNRKTVLRYEFYFDAGECADFEAEVGHAINGSLKIHVEFGRTQRPRVAFPKGRYSRDFESKREAISTFLARRVSLRYIPAVRNSDDTFAIIDDLVTLQMIEARQRPELEAALRALEEAQRPLLDSLQATVRDTVASLLPTVTSVDIKLQPASTTTRVSSLTIDDGQKTGLDAKGDGVQSLAAIALAKHHAVTGPHSPFVILAVEEPEAHLHPDAVHQIHKALVQMAEEQQVLVATHSPILVNRGDVSSNVIVEKGTARHAESLAELREVLGVRSADNLSSASLVVLVEGMADVRIVEALLRARSGVMEDAFSEGAVALFGCGGASQVVAQLRIHQSQVFACHAIFDNDDEGRAALGKAEAAQLVSPSQVSMMRIPGRDHTEIEDLIQPGVYCGDLKGFLGVDLKLVHKGCKKSSPSWAKRVGRLVLDSGHPWSEASEARAKELVADAVVMDPEHALLSPAAKVFDNLADTIVERLRLVDGTK